MSRPEILMTGPIMPMIVEGLDRAFPVVHKLWEAKDKDGFLAEVAPRVRGIACSGHPLAVDAAFLARFPALEIVSSFGVGYDHVDAREAGRRGIVVTNTPDVLTEEVADTAIGLMLMTVRQLPQSERYLRAGQWLKAAFPLSPSMRDRTVGILGLGRIGLAIARRLDAMGVPVVYHNRRARSDVPYRWYDTLAEMAADVDVLMIVTPGGAETKNIVDAGILKALGPNGVLINVARGSVVDEPALIAALRNGTILSAGLDVFADEPRVPQELIDMEHVVLLPHVGSASHHTRRGMGQLVIDNLVAWAEGRGPLTPVAETPWRPKA